MQTWLSAGAGDPPIESGDGLVRDGLAHWLSLPRRPALAAWGQPAPVPGATVTGTTRLILALSGRNTCEYPCHGRLLRGTPPPGGSLLVDRRAWNRPLDIHAKDFLTIDVRLDYVRLYRRRTAGPGALPADHCRTLLLHPPSAALRSAADAAEALAGDPGSALDTAAVLLATCALRELDLAVIAVDSTWQRLREWLEERLHLPISRDAAAHAVGIHPVHVSRLFARHAGCGFAAWVAGRRVERAKDLLADPDLGVAAIAHRCGFSSPAWFAATFQRVVGTSPTRWRLGSDRRAVPSGGA